MRILIVPFLLALASACGPSALETEDRVDAYLSRGDVASACGGLLAREDRVRMHTVKKIAEFKDNAAGAACLAEAVYDADKGTWDEAIAEALDGSRIDAAAKALGKALMDDRISDRAAVATALGRIIAPSGFKTLTAVAKDTSQPEDVRAAAVAGLVAAKDAVDIVLPLLASDPSEAVRAGAAEALANRSSSKVEGALVKAARTDASAAVRVAAVRSMGEDPDGSMGKAVCELMLQDEDPGVRAAAVTAFKSTLNQERARCLAKKLEAGDDDGSVREALLEALKGSPTPAAAKALCDEIGPWVKRYGVDKNVYEIPGADIVTAQNFRDFDNSLACVNKARNTSGLSCYAKNYLAHWVNDLGGTASPPLCPGMAKIK